MNECFKCGISGERAFLFDAISDKGIVKICRKCSFEEDIPIIRKQINNSMQQFSQKKTVHERLSRMSGIKKQESISEENKKLLDKQETSLKDVVNKNFEAQIKYKKPRPDLVDNFHWIIMRARRIKKITQKQLAKAIVEPEAAIKMAEQGVLSDDNKLIKKIENYLGIRLRKKTEQEISEKEIVEQEQPPTLGFDTITTKTLTISNLQEMKKKREEEIFEKPEEDYVFNEKINLEDDEPEFVEKQSKDDLSQDEINDVIFGRKNDKEI